MPLKVVILAGGLGTRLAEKTDVVPKPMVEIGGRPILWHIMKSYAHYGFNEFIIPLGYRGEVIKDYFLNYHSLRSNFTVDLATGAVDKSDKNHEDNWKVTMVDTGQETMTGGRILCLRNLIGDNTFMMTYGDGVSDVDINELLKFHKQHGKYLTLTAVHPKGHYGELELSGDRINKFIEKPEFKQSWINGGFMVIEPEVFDLIDDSETVFEQEPLEKLADSENLMAFKHQKFWQCMDNLRDVRYLNSLWESHESPWAVWRVESIIS